MAASIIEESLICHEICSWLHLSELNKIRETCSSFRNVIETIIREVDVIATNGIYKRNGSYYIPHVEKPLCNELSIVRETSSYIVIIYRDNDYFLVKPGVDHIIFDGYVAVIKNDYLKMHDNRFYHSEYAKKPDANDYKYMHSNCFDYGTWKYSSTKDISLKECRFKEIEVRGDMSNVYRGNLNEHVISIDGDIMTIMADNNSTIDMWLNILTGLNIHIKKIYFDAKLIFYF